MKLNLYQIATCLLAGFAEPIYSTLKMEAICSSETSVETQRTTRLQIPEERTLHMKLNLYQLQILLGAE
jgi:hypothetical protein